MNIATTVMPVSHTALVFPGQGSQKAGMLSELAESFTLIGQTFDEASDALGLNLWDIAQGDERLNQTEYTQPVLLTASIALWRLWLELGGTRPAVVAGHSLGEYSALVAAGVMTLTDAVRLVRERGRLMQVAVPAGEGAMAAILGLDDATVIAQCAHVSALTQHCVDAANFNAEGQVVIAGHADTVRQAIVALKSVGGKAIMLPVSVPSHCRLMQPAADQLSALLADLTLHEPDMPVIQNARARLETHPAAIRQALIDQLCQPVRWTQSMQRIVEMGMTQVVECGAGNVLSNLAKRMSTPLDAYAIDTRIRFEQALSAVSLAEGNLA